MGGFIVGFDSDQADIFDRQIQFIERAAIPWAMAGVLQAIPNTPLYARMKREGRLLDASAAVFTNFTPPNFQTILPLAELLGGVKRMLLRLYDPHHFYERALDSLERWQVRPEQSSPALSFQYQVKVLFKSIWLQGVLSSYRRAYWRFLGRLLQRWGLHPQKRRLGFELGLSGHHFIRYAKDVAETLEGGRHRALQPSYSELVCQTALKATNLASESE